MIIDCEALVGDYLRNHADITALGANVGASTPKTQSKPWVRVTQLDAIDRAFPIDHLVEYMCQFDCYASDVRDGGHAEANTLARTVRAALHDLPDQDLDGAVAPYVRFTGMLRLLDTVFKPARQRVVLTADIRMYPRPGP